MEIINRIEDLPAAWQKRSGYVAVALGNFDGVHIGHKTLLKTMVKAANLREGVSMAFSFSPHPMEVLTGKCPPKLNTEEQRAALIAGLGVDYLFNFPFTLEAANQLPEDFVKEFLIDGLRAKHVTVGFNYSFGRQGKGNPELLQRLCRQYGCETAIVPPVETRDGVVSSTLIRKKIGRGEICSANELLGYRYTLSGPVVHGRQLGRQLGFPTANVEVPEEMQLPAFGVYAAFAYCEGQALPAVVNVGLRPTIDDNLKPTVEANILDFDGDLYDKWLDVRFVAEIRPEQKFNGLEALKTQIGKDAGTAAQILHQAEK